MLKIIMGAWEVPKYLKNKSSYEYYFDRYFDFEVHRSWFKDDVAKMIIKNIAKGKIVNGVAIKFIDGHAKNQIHSVKDINLDAKLLFAIRHNCKKVFYLIFNDRAKLDYLELVVSEWNNKGKDVILVADSLPYFHFKFIDSVEFINWGIICYSEAEINEKVRDKWWKLEYSHHMERKRAEYDDEDDEDDEDYGNDEEG